MATTIPGLIDVDARMLAEGSVTQMAVALDHAMEHDASARAAYARIYGRPWVSLIDQELASMNSHAPSTYAATAH